MKIILSLIISIFLITYLFGCDEEVIEVEEGISSLTFYGVEDQTVSRNTTVDLLEGVSILGDDGIDYIDHVITNSYSCEIKEHTITISNIATCDVTYVIVVDNIYNKTDITIKFK